jgi:hypothetical protein
MSTVSGTACRQIWPTIIDFFYFAPIMQSVISITLKWVLKRRSFRYAFQEHLLKFLMLAVTHSELLLRDHCTSQHFKFKTYNCSSIYQRYYTYLSTVITREVFFVRIKLNFFTIIWLLGKLTTQTTR